MKTISIHGVDKEAEKLIRERAKSQSLSVNKVVKNLIADALGMDGKTKKKDKTDDYTDLCGVWTKGEAEKFLDTISDLKVIDSEDWK